MNFNKKATLAGYYLITLRPSSQGLFLSNNGERAFVVSHLQDTLTMRLLPEMQPISQNIANHIDLLAFSILKEAVQMVVFAISTSSAQLLATSLNQSIERHKNEWSQSHESPNHQTQTSISLRKLTGQHDALQTSIQLHIGHLDWEYDRYSSVGFYLHDRRGDWMRIWRLTHLYENDTNNYRNLCLLALNNFNLETTRAAVSVV